MQRFVIYNFSGDVDEISHLFPSERFARMGAIISAAGRHVEIMDRANFADVIAIGAEFMQALASLSFHDTSPLYEEVVRRETAAVLDRKPDCVFLNLWRGTGFKFSMDMLTALKQQQPDLRVYGFGQKVDEFKGYILQFTGERLDGLISGLGYDAVARIVAGSPREEVPNLIYESDGEPMETTRVPVDVDAYPDAVYDDAVYKGLDDKVPVYSTSLSNQACPNQCAFCIRPQVYGRVVRKRNTDGVVRELEKLHHEKGITHFRIEDSTPPPRALTRLAEALVASGLAGKIRLSAFARVDSNRSEDFKLLKQAGIISLFFGIESLDEGTLKMLNKRTTPEVIRATLQRAHDAGILTVGSFIFPTPGLTREAMQTTLGRIKDLKPWLDSALVLPAVVQPHTAWFHSPEMYGFKLGDDYIRDGVIFPVKYLVPIRLWKPFPVTYRLMDKEADQVTFEDIVNIQTEFVDVIRNKIGIPGIPDYYFLVADLLQRPPAETAGTIVRHMIDRDYEALRNLFV